MDNSSETGLNDSLKKEQELHAEIIRQLSQHENTLFHNRITWHAGFQLILFAGLAALWNQADDSLDYVLMIIISMLGVGTAYASHTASGLVLAAQKNLKEWWVEHLVANGYQGPPRVGLEIVGNTRRELSWVISWLLVGAWMVVMIIVGSAAFNKKPKKADTKPPTIIIQNY